MRMNRDQLAAQFKETNDGALIFIGDEAIVTINAKYENFGCFNVDKGIDTLAIFNLNINGLDYGYNLPAIIKMNPTSFELVKNGKDEEYRLTFKKNDIFMKSTTVVKRTDLVFAIFKMYVFFGIRYNFLNENNISRLFDWLYMTGFNMEYTYSSVPSAMFSELYRNPDNIQELNRFTKQDRKGTAIAMKQVALTARTLTAKLSGSYLKENITSAVIHTHQQNSEIEDLLRR